MKRFWGEGELSFPGLVIPTLPAGADGTSWTDTLHPQPPVTVTRRSRDPVMPREGKAGAFPQSTTKTSYLGLKKEVLHSGPAGSI